MADKFIIVGETDKKQCETCNQFFDPQDMNSPNGEYLEACEARTRNSGPFPEDLPPSAKFHPHTFCSEECEQDACDQVRLGHIELQRMVEEGEIEDTPSLDMEPRSYSL